MMSPLRCWRCSLFRRARGGQRKWCTNDIIIIVVVIIIIIISNPTDKWQFIVTLSVFTFCHWIVNQKLEICIAPTKAKSREPAYSQALVQSKINRQQVRSRESSRQSNAIQFLMLLWKTALLCIRVLDVERVPVTRSKYLLLILSIYGIYIAPLQANYSEAFPAQARAKRKVLRRLVNCPSLLAPLWWWFRPCFIKLLQPTKQSRAAVLNLWNSKTTYEFCLLAIDHHWKLCHGK